MAVDPFHHTADGIEGPAEHAFAVSPSDSGDLDFVTRALYVGGAGDVAVVMKDGGSVTFSGVAAGSLLPLRIARVKATGTTATGIIGVY